MMIRPLPYFISIITSFLLIIKHVKGRKEGRKEGRTYKRYSIRKIDTASDEIFLYIRCEEGVVVSSADHHYYFMIIYKVIPKIMVPISVWKRVDFDLERSTVLCRLCIRIHVGKPSRPVCKTVYLHC
jgi:hypothetical protein